ncbi:MAG TPA: hypothetical protein VG815_01325 [Chloroflexota bacterium]|jgi:hypothetical protein|nr:hypothetical protein [Chloroflexota bacterium]
MSQWDAWQLCELTTVYIPDFFYYPVMYPITDTDVLSNGTYYNDLDEAPNYTPLKNAYSDWMQGTDPGDYFGRHLARRHPVNTVRWRRGRMRRAVFA